METNEARLNSELCGTLLYYSSLSQLSPPYPSLSGPCFACLLFVCSFKIPTISLSLAHSVSLTGSRFVPTTPPTPLFGSTIRLRSIALLGPCQICQERLLLEALFSDAAAVLHPLLIGFSLPLFPLRSSSEETRECARTSWSRSLTFFRT